MNYVPRCCHCDEKNDDMIRIAVDIKDKNTKEIKLTAYTEPICFLCVDKYFKSKRRMSIYV